MKTTLTLVLACLIFAGCASEEQAEAVPETPQMSFFLTSMNPGDGADLGGLEGADEYCVALATEVGMGDSNWKAYLSTTTVNARDRIGTGPWHNAEGVEIASDLDMLHGENNLTKETQLNERGEVVNGRGDDPNRHDILTGSTNMGMSFGDDGTDYTCSDWTSSTEDGSANVGHHDRTGGGADPTSWNAAHGSRGCSLPNLQGTGGDGLFYCFVSNQ